MDILLSLPHPLPEIWVIWLILLIPRLKVLYGPKDASHQLSQTGELMSFKEIAAQGCLGGFILLTFITVFCTYLVMKTKHLI